MSMIVIGCLGTLILALLVTILCSFTTIRQGQVGVVERFGKYARVARPGLNWLTPFVESVSITLSLQQIAQQFSFVVITKDQASVAFGVTILVEPFDASDETVQLMAYKFEDEAMMNTAVEGAVESSIRATVSDKLQAEILGMKSELVRAIKADLDPQLQSWGWHLRDTQINSIKFDESIMASMSRVVAGKNALQAAEFEGQALLVQKTKAAEANGKAIVIAAQAEAEAERQRGQGLAWFQEEIGKGLAESAEVVKKHGFGTDLLMLAMWVETLKSMAAEGRGNTFFFDGSVDSLQRTLRQLQSKFKQEVQYQAQDK